MSDTFLLRLMELALATTSAERGMAVNGDGQVVGLEGLSDAEVQDGTFTGFRNIEQAYDSGERPHITNNMLLDSETAPTTNTNFANLRLVVIFPLGEVGAVYIDQHVRHGVVDQQTAVRIQAVAEQLLQAGDIDLSTEEMAAALAAQGS